MSSTTSTTASNTIPSAQGSSRTNASDPEVTSLMSEVAVANQSAEVQPAQARQIRQVAPNNKIKRLLRS